MKKKICFTLSILALATACGGKPEIHSGAQTPAPVTGEETAEGALSPEPTAEPAPSPIPSQLPTMAPTPQTTLEEWTATMPEKKPDYSIAEKTLELHDYAAWPERPVVLQIDSWKGTLEEAAKTYGVPLETLQALNPDPETSERDGVTTYYNLKLQENYQVPRPDSKQVTISMPWVASRWERTASYEVPAALSDQAAACMASAYDFDYNHNGMSGGIWPAEYDEETGWYTAKEGGLYTTYSDLTRYLEAVYSPAVCEGILGGPVAEENPEDWHPYY